MTQASDVRECPYCKETIKSDAIRCKHCRSAIAPSKPGHGGICPFCKESVHLDAIKCKHCGAMIGPEPADAGEAPCRCTGQSNAPLVAGVGTWPRVDPHDLAPGVIPQAGDGCGQCEETGQWSISGGRVLVLQRSKVCCMTVEIAPHRYRKICWAEACTPKFVDLQGL